MPGGPPVAGLPSDQLHQEARMAARYDQGDAASSLDAEEAEGEAHGWLIARLASPFWLVAVVFALGCSAVFIQSPVYCDCGLDVFWQGSLLPAMLKAIFLVCSLLGTTFVWLSLSGCTAHMTYPSIYTVC